MPLMDSSVDADFVYQDRMSRLFKVIADRAALAPKVWGVKDAF